MFNYTLTSHSSIVVNQIQISNYNLLLAIYVDVDASIKDFLEYYYAGFQNYSYFKAQYNIDVNS